MTEDRYQEPVDGRQMGPVQEVPQPLTQSSPKKTVLPPAPVPDPMPSPTPVAPIPSVKPVQPVQPTEDSTKEEQVKRLTQIAFDQGITEAIEEAKKLNNPYILDEFHDVLTDDFYKKLVEAGKLEQR